MKSFMKWATIFALPALLLGLVGVPAHALSALTHLGMVGVVGATIGAGQFTLLDWAKRQNPDGTIADIAELLTQNNEMLDDIWWKMGNLPTGDRVTVRTSLPTGIARLFNQGVPNTKSTTAQSDEQAAMFEDRSQLDVDLVSLEDDEAAARFSEGIAHIEGLNQLFSKKLIYGNAGTSPAEFTGLALRYGAISGAPNAQNIISAGGVGSVNTSIYLVGWGPNALYGIFPKGSVAGLYHKDLGEGDAFDANNNRFRAYMDRWQWKGGIAVKDWRWCVRICNIDVTALVADPTGATVQLINYMSKAIDRVPSAGGARLAFYCNRTVKSMLRTQALNKSVAQLGVEKAINQFGSTIFQLEFLGIPVRTVDQIVETEARVV